MKIYIAGPMRGIKYWNFEAFDEAKLLLKSNYPDAFIVSPADIDRQYGIDPFAAPKDYDWNNLPADIMLSAIARRDLNELVTCTHICLLDGWERSKGALAERAVAEWLGLEVIE